MKEPLTTGFWQRPLVHIVLIVTLGLLVYSNTFDVPFIFDDGPNISQNQIIRSLDNIPYMFSGGEGPFASRPLLHATTAANYYFGGLNPRGYHYVNVFLHLLNGLLLYVLITATGRHRAFPENSTAVTALASSLLFVVHPVQTEAVTYIISRSMLLSTTFYLMGIVFFLKTVTSERKKGLFIAGLFIVSLFGMGSRENFVTFPLMLFTYDLFFVSGFNLRETARHYKAYLPAILSLGYLAFLVLNNSYDRSAEYLTEHIPSTAYALTQFGVHWTYIRLLVFPFNQNLDYAYPVARAFFEFPALISTIGFAALLVGSTFLARRKPPVSFCILWFLIALFPISFGIALVKGIKLDDVIFEHRLYLPSIGIIVLLGMSADVLYRKFTSPRLRLVAVAMSLTVLISLAAAAHARNSVWQSQVKIWEDAVAKSPKKVRTRFNLGVAYGIEGQKQKAIEQYRTAIILDPTSPMPHVNLGNAYRSMGMNDKAEYHYQLALTYDPDNPEASKGMGVIYAAEGMSERAINQYRLALSKNPNDAIAHVNLGIAYRKTGQAVEAQRHIKEALRLNPDIVMSFVNHGAMYLSMGQTDMAIEQFEKALAIDPDSSSAHLHLGKAYRLKGMTEKALEHYNRSHEDPGVEPSQGSKHP